MTKVLSACGRVIENAVVAVSVAVLWPVVVTAVLWRVVVAVVTSETSVLPSLLWVAGGPRAFLKPRLLCIISCISLSADDAIRTCSLRTLSV